MTRFRLTACAAAGVLLTLNSAPLLAQQKTLMSPPMAAPSSRRMRKDVIPAFEAKHNVKVEYVAGNSTDTLAKLQAQKANQQYRRGDRRRRPDVSGHPARLLRARSKGLAKRRAL